MPYTTRVCLLQLEYAFYNALLQNVTTHLRIQFLILHLEYALQRAATENLRQRPARNQKGSERSTLHIDSPSRINFLPFL